MNRQLASQRELQRKVIKHELKKCKEDILYFAKKYVWIQVQNEKSGKALFETFEFQDDAMNTIQNNRYVIVNKGRQMGISTLVSLKLLHMLLFDFNKHALIVAIQEEVAKNLLRKVQFAYENLPDWLKRPTVINSATKLELDTGSSVKAVAASLNATRSASLTLLVLDEAAFIDNVEDIWTAASPTLATGGSAIVISTPNGQGNWFHKEVMKAKAKKSLFELIELPWHLHPDRDQTWRDAETKKMGEQRAAQENDCSFLATGDTFFNLVKLEEISKRIESYVKILETEYDGNMEIYEYPDPEKEYITVADVARGDGNDESAFHIFDMATNTQVLEFSAKVGTKDFARILMEWSMRYNGALLSVEREVMGWGVIQDIIDAQYPNLYYSWRDDGYIDVARHVVNLGQDIEQKDKMTPGFSTNAITRPLILGKLQSAIHNDTITIRGIRTIQQMKTFIWLRNKPQAMSGYFDDLVLSCAQYLHIKDTAMRLKYLGQKLTDVTLNNHKTITNYMPQFGSQLANNPGEQYWKMNTGNDEVDLTWLM